MKQVFLVIFSLFALIYIGCNHKPQKETPKTRSVIIETRIIVVYSGGCSEDEVAYDLEQSIESNSAFFEKNHIAIQVDSVDSKCGYLLKWNKKEKEINMVMTDIDLQNTVKQFFEMK